MRSHEFGNDLTEASFIDFIRAAFNKDPDMDQMSTTERARELYQDRGMKMAGKAASGKWLEQIRAIKRAFQTIIDPNTGESRKIDQTVFMEYLTDFVQDMFFRGKKIANFDTTSQGFIKNAMGDVWTNYTQNNRSGMDKAFMDITARSAAVRMQDIADTTVQPLIQGAINSIMTVAGKNPDAKVLRQLGDQIKKNGITEISKQDIADVVGAANVSGAETLIQAAGIKVTR